jgi:catechol 2,3-dioxygenase
MNNQTSTAIDPRVRIGHIHLKVADLDRSIAFYHGVFGSRSRSAGARRPRSSPPGGITTISV